VTFTATVTSGLASPTPAGTVTFLDGTTPLGTGTLDNTGHAVLTVSALGVGSHTITASYSGDSNFSGSTSTPPSQSVSRVATNTLVVSSVNPSVFGQPVTFTAAVAGVAGTATPTGTVSFLDGTTTLGTGTLNASGQAAFTTAALASGSHSITAVYG